MADGGRPLPMSPLSPNMNGFARSTTINDFRRRSSQLTPEPSPQAWLASSKRRARPGALDPPASPLDMLSPITEPLDPAQWNKRMSLLTHRYLREYGIDREEEIVDKAFRTLGLFCVGDEAIQSLENFKSTFARLSTTFLQSYRVNPLERSSSWISFPSFLDDSFNLSFNSLSVDQRAPDSGMLSNITNGASASNRPSQTLSHSFNKRNSFQNIDKIHPDNSPSSTTMSGDARPRYMTHTFASKAQNSTVQPLSRPTTPASAASSTEKRSWIATAGRRMGITTPKSKTEDSPHDKTSIRSHSPNKFTVNPKQSTVKDHNNEAQGRPTTKGNEKGNEAKRDAVRIHEARMNRLLSPPAPRSPIKAPSGIPRPERKESPPDKPLPSLPVASIRPRSPIVRRSLIDATERPLRKSLSPSPGVDGHDEWPAIPPSRPTTPNTKQSYIPNTSGGATMMSHKERQNTLVKEECNQNERTSHEKSVHDASGQSKPAGGEEITPDTETLKQEEQVQGAVEMDDTASVQDASANTAPSEHRGHTYHSRSVLEPRQTKTSMMRARLSSGSNHSPDTDSKVVGQKSTSPHLPSPHDYSKVKADSGHQQPSIPGPVRSLSRTRREDSPPYNPYSQRRRGVTRQAKSDIRTDQPRASSPKGVLSSRNHTSGPADLVAIKQGTGFGNGIHKSLIPTRRQSSKNELEDSEADVLITKPAKHGGYRDEEEGVEDADIDTDHGALLVRHKVIPENAGAKSAERSGIEHSVRLATSDVPVSYSQGQTHDDGSAQKIPAELQPSVTTSSTTVVEEEEALCTHSPNDSDLLSLQDFAASEPANYRVKRLSHAAPEHGPILRIAEDAEKILFGPDSEEMDAGRDSEAAKISSMTDLRKSIVIREQLKASKERILRGPMSRSTTSCSLSKPATESSSSTAHEHSTVIAGAAAEAGSRLNASGTVPHTNDEDPFVFSGLRSPEGPDAENQAVEGDFQWPFRCAEAPPRGTKTVLKRASEEEDSWIPPLATDAIQNDEGVANPTIKAIDEMPASKDVQGLQQISSGNSELQTRQMAVAEDQKTTPGTAALHGTGRSTFPARVSSRTQFQEMIRDRNDKDGQVSSLHLTGPEIPNRFASVRAANQSKAIARTPASVTRSESVLRLDYGTSTKGASGLRDRLASESAKTQPSTTKGMLSNFRGLFNKRSLESTDAMSAMSSAGSIRLKNVKVGKNGSPFPFINGRHPSKPLSNDQSRGSLRGTQTPAGIGGGQATPNTSPALPTPVLGETEDAERLARQVLDSAMLETNAQKKAYLAKLGQLMVHAVTASKDAEKAVEEARQAASMAEVHSMDARRCLWHVSKIVESILTE